MKRIYVNLKRFDVPAQLGGVNRLAPVEDWAKTIMEGVAGGLAGYGEDVEAVFFFPEAHLLGAVKSRPGKVKIGCQGVFRDDVAPGGNFGAFTAGRPAAAAKALGCQYALIGHCEERRDLLGIVSESGGDPDCVSRILNREIHSALGQGLSVLYCVGETAQEHDNWKAVLGQQLEAGLDGVSGPVTIAYEPVWAIGPGKTPPGADYIKMVAAHIKEMAGNLPVVYGGGLKTENAKMLASIEEIDGGLIALTRFSGEIGFYPDEYCEIVREYMGR